jgi:hypothetical protein
VAHEKRQISLLYQRLRHARYAAPRLKSGRRGAKAWRTKSGGIPGFFYHLRHAAPRLPEKRGAGAAQTSCPYAILLSKKLTSFDTIMLNRCRRFENDD